MRAGNIKLTVLIIVLAALPCVPPGAYALPNDLEIVFLAVADGDSILVATPHGENVLIDAGNPISGMAVADELKKRGLKSIDTLILTHPHPDHFGGVFALIHLFDIGRIYDNGEDLEKEPDNEQMHRWYNQAVRKRLEYKSLKRGEKIRLDAVDLEIIWPRQPNDSSDWNTNSLVTMIKYGDFRCLVMSDANQAVERELFRLEGGKLQARILKGGHHGAADTADTEFIAAVRPKLVVLSVDQNRTPGFPDSGAVKRYRQAGAEILQTGVNGNITVKAAADGSFKVFHPQERFENNPTGPQTRR